MTLRVECYSGYKADERPLRFQIDESNYNVAEVMDQWHSPDATYFKVCADDGNIYVLRHAISPQDDAWTLEAFRRAKP